MHTSVVGEYEQQFLNIRMLSDVDENVSEKHVIDSINKDQSTSRLYC